MTVGELKKELDKYDDNLLIQIYDDGINSDIEHVKLLIDKCIHCENKKEHSVVMISAWYMTMDEVV